jgi:ABC-type sugar transport system ATPase subunit
VTEPSPPLFRAEGLSKAFGHVQALSGVSFELREGEVLALLGDNGAGKSTLVKILSGLYAPDHGRMLLDGEDVEFARPKDASRAGIATVYQDLALVDSREVSHNLFLGQESRFRRGPFIDRRRMRRDAEDVLGRVGVRLPSVRVPVSMLSGGQRQGVAVARTLVHGARMVMLDEPTAALGVSQSEQVMKLVGELRASGRGVIVISHNLRQVWDVADRFLVLYHGVVAGIRGRSETTLEEIVRLIVYGPEAETVAASEQPVVA